MSLSILSFRRYVYIVRTRSSIIQKGEREMSKTDKIDEVDSYKEPECFGECRGCLVSHCVHAKECFEVQKAREDEEHKAEVHDMQMAALWDERYI